MVVVASADGAVKGAGTDVGGDRLARCGLGLKYRPNPPLVERSAIVAGSLLPSMRLFEPALIHARGRAPLRPWWSSCVGGLRGKGGRGRAWVAIASRGADWV